MKEIYGLLILLLCFSLGSAASLYSHTVDTLQLFEKNPNTWEIVNGGAYGVIEFKTTTKFDEIVRQSVKVSAWRLEPRTKYQLIYYGNDEVNDVWPYATCIGRAKITSRQGFLKSGSTPLNHLNIKYDGINQKFWLVKASDVNCKEGKMIAWNPTEYLFEYNVYEEGGNDDDIPGDEEYQED